MLLYVATRIINSSSSLSLSLSLSDLAVSLKAASAVEAYVHTCCNLRSGAPELGLTEETFHCITQPLVMYKSGAMQSNIV